MCRWSAERGHAKSKSQPCQLSEISSLFVLCYDRLTSLAITLVGIDLLIELVIVFRPHDHPLSSTEMSCSVADDHFPG